MSGKADSGKKAKDGAAKNFGNDGAPAAKTKAMLPCKEKHWIGVRVVNEKGKPVQGTKIKIKLTNGSTVEIASDKKGMYKTDKVLPAGSCDIWLPEIYDPEWKEHA